MRERARSWGLGLAVVIAALGALQCEGGDQETKEAVSVVRSALTNHIIQLPVPVGIGPTELTLSAKTTVVLNDRARVQNSVGQPADIAALGTTGQTSLGVGAIARNVYSNPGVFLRGSTVNFLRTGGFLTIQAGTTILNPQDTRQLNPVRLDPIWTIATTTPDLTTSDHIAPGQTLTLANGAQRGHVFINRGAALVFSNSGNYHFTSLYIEPGSTVTLPTSGPVRIFVSQTLILRSPVVAPAGAALVLSYLGTGSVHVESPFDGDLFLAPNATVEIKFNVRGSFFANQITVHQDRVITQRPLSNDSQALIRPDDFAQASTPLTPTGPAEISGVVTPASFNSSCVTTPIGLLSHQGSTVLRAPGLTGGNNQTLGNAPAPAACIGVALPDVPGQIITGTPTPGQGIPSYGPLFTDSLTARLSGGRVLQVGLNGRLCIDPAQGQHCPATNPAGTLCNGVTATTPCYYSGNFVRCQTVVPSVQVWAGGATNCPAAEPANNSTCSPATFPVPCLYVAGGTTAFPNRFCSCQSPANTWTCGSRQRPDGRTLAFRITSTCGASWNDIGVLDPQAVTLTPDVAVTKGLDRQEMHLDPITNQLYLAVQTSPTFQNFGDPNSRAIVVVGNTLAPNAQALVQSMIANPRIRSEPLNDNSHQVMTTVLEEQASFPGAPTGPYTHFVRLQCRKNTAGQPKPMLEADTPFGRVTIDLAGNDPDRFCQVTPNSVGTTALVNVLPGLSVVGISGVVPRVRAVYTATIGGSQVLHVFMVTLLGRNNYQNPEIVYEGVVRDFLPNAHIMWPQLIAADHFAGSNVQIDTPVVLRWADVAGDTVTERFRVLHWGLPFTVDRSLAQWTISRTTMVCGTNGCFAGDYRYGSFFEKTVSPLGTLRFFTPWTGSPSSTVTNPIQAFASSVLIIFGQ